MEVQNEVEPVQVKSQTVMAHARVSDQMGIEKLLGKWFFLKKKKIKKFFFIYLFIYFWLSSAAACSFFLAAV